MKNGKSELITLMPRAIGAVLIICACLLVGGASASGQEAGKPVIEPSDKFVKDGTKATTTARTGFDTTTTTEIYKDAKGEELVRVETTISPDRTYGKNGAKKITTQRFTAKYNSQKFSEPENQGPSISREEKLYSKPLTGDERDELNVREVKTTYTFPGQGQRKIESIQYYDDEVNVIFSKEIHTGILGEETLKKR